ncbi:Transcription factor bHLH51 [Heracleum sosnowskyi]|uniref:Transcription factor bHLH51 n=1 Tax=Heracleum sosnowskyi TaxID=360622 RepID=A0AAD8J654_9APIA|nr:Transcription factor bHLH51 [Heracleum sosnowskyi]
MESYYWHEEAATEAWQWHHPQSQVGGVNEDLGSTSSLQFPCTSLRPDDSNLHMLGLSQLAPSFQGVEEDRSTASASKSHSQAEKRRRDRINAQLATLRKLIPKSDKMDKAALLGSAVEHLKELKRKALEVSKQITIPTGIDEVTVTDCGCDEEAGSTTSNSIMLIRVSICCENRPELFGELNHAIESLRLRMIQADMCCLGGRIKTCFVVCTKDSDNLNVAADATTIKQSLKLVLSRLVTSSTCSNYRAKSKRQRFFFPPYFSH